TIGHVFAPYAPPRQAAITEAEYEQYHEVPERYFRAIDEVLGQYRRAAEANGAVLMLASDHGFQWGEGRPTKLSSVATATAARWRACESRNDGQGRPREPSLARLHWCIGKQPRPGRTWLDAIARFLQQRGSDPQGARQVDASHRGIREGAHARSCPAVGTV